LWTSGRYSEVVVSSGVTVDETLQELSNIMSMAIKWGQLSMLDSEHFTVDSVDLSLDTLLAVSRPRRLLQALNSTFGLCLSLKLQLLWRRAKHILLILRVNYKLQLFFCEAN
jgi:hypothetical protein